MLSFKCKAIESLITYTQYAKVSLLFSFVFWSGLHNIYLHLSNNNTELYLGKTISRKSVKKNNVPVTPRGDAELFQMK